MANKSPYWIKVRGAPHLAWQRYNKSRGKKEAVKTSAAKVWEPFEAVLATWDGAINVKVWKDLHTGAEMCRIELIPWPPGSHGRGAKKVLYEGTLAGQEKLLDEQLTMAPLLGDMES